MILHEFDERLQFIKKNGKTKKTGFLGFEVGEETFFLTTLHEYMGAHAQVDTN